MNKHKGRTPGELERMNATRKHHRDTELREQLREEQDNDDQHGND